MDPLRQRLLDLVNFLKDYASVVDSHMVSFITEDYWRTAPYHLKNQFEEDNESAINDFFIDPVGSSEVSKFLQNCQTYSSKQDALTMNELTDKLRDWNCRDPTPPDLGGFMSEKKVHEVEIMGGVVASLADNCDARFAVDFGDGKGYLSSLLSLYYRLKILGLDASAVRSGGARKRTEIIKKHWKTYKNSTRDLQNEGSYKHRTIFVETDTNLLEIIAEEFAETPKSVGLVGLHTCGALGTTAIRQFVSHDQFSFLVNVACCYHLCPEDDFPLSSWLKTQGFELSRNARMLALHAFDRTLAERSLPSDTLIYRAILEHYFINVLNRKGLEVGRIGNKASCFIDYAHQAFKKLGLNVEMSETELADYYAALLYHEPKLRFYFYIRVALAPVVENIILLDRLLYLKEQGIRESVLVNMFDPVVSPRNFALVAIKKPKHN